jgi:undecaprenyl-diphosphatase
VAFLTSGWSAGGLTAGTLVLGTVLSSVGVVVAGEILRSLADRRRLAVLALWTVPLGLATLAYARALPLPT